MGKFNKFLDEGIKVFRQGQLTFDNFDIGNEEVSNYVYDMLHLYKSNPNKFFDNIAEVFFELGSLQMKTAFFMYVFFAESYNNVFDSKVAKQYIANMIKILTCIKKMDVNYQHSFIMNKLIVQFCCLGFEEIFDDFSVVKLEMKDSIYYFDIINSTQQSKLCFAMNYKNDGSSNTTFILPYYYHVHPLLGDRRQYFSYMQVDAKSFVTCLEEGDKEFIDFISAVVSVKSIPAVCCATVGDH